MRQHTAYKRSALGVLDGKFISRADSLAMLYRQLRDAAAHTQREEFELRHRIWIATLSHMGVAQDLAEEAWAELIESAKPASAPAEEVA